MPPDSPKIHELLTCFYFVFMIQKLKGFASDMV